MPICALPPIRIFEDFDKMSAKEVFYTEVDDKKIAKLLSYPITSPVNSESDIIETNSSCCSSNEEECPNTSKRLQRKISDGIPRKRSTTNLFYKCSKAFSDTRTPPYRKTSTGSKSDDTKLKSSTSNRRYLEPPMKLIPSSSGGLRKQLLQRRSPSPSHYFDDFSIFGTSNMCPGYVQYQKSLLEVPLPKDYGDASSDDLSSEWDSDVPEPQRSPKPSGWRKLRNIVQWTPFFQTYKKQRYPWVQLAGHQGNFKAGPDQGTVLKKLCPKEEKCFHVLMRDVLRPYVPEYKGQVTSDDGELYLQLQDLLSDFNQPCVMDCKIGVRTYLEEELSKAKEKPKLRKDMYEKMIQIDPAAPSEDENKAKGVTKPRYMVWRETISSTATLGFRIEGIKKGDGTSSKDFKTTKSKEQILHAFKDFTSGFSHTVAKYIQRLRAIRATLECSDFFTSHEVIGSSLLFVHDQNQASIWLIDFAKTVILPTNTNIDHNSKWSVGNHEDGYLIGINNLIKMFEELQSTSSSETVPISSPEIDVRINNNTEKVEDLSLNS